MKIAYIVSLFPALSETFILNELINHEKAGLEVTVFSIKKFNGGMVHNKAAPLIDKTVYLGGQFWIKIFFLHLYILVSRPKVYLATLYKLLFFKTNIKIRLNSLAVFFCSPYYSFVAKKQNITHLHAHFATYPALLAWILSRFNSIPFSVTAHAHDIYLNQDVLKIFSDDAKAIITISNFNKNFILDKLGWKATAKEKIVSVIHCGLDLTAFDFNADKTSQYGTDRKFRILSVGRLSGIKGYKYLLDALALLKEGGYEFSCEIIGDGPLKHELRKQSDALNLDVCVTFLGAKTSDEVIAQMREADLFVIACAIDKHEGHDGIPVAFMEAMALGVPVIGTSISGIPELIIHGKTGLCASPQNPTSLKENISHRIDNYGNTFDMVKNAKFIIEQEFDIEKNSKILRNIFQSGDSHDQSI
jgi:colanic acid/amylovoran biosynthesis glycosyltransferase